MTSEWHGGHESFKEKEGWPLAELLIEHVVEYQSTTGRLWCPCGYAPTNFADWAEHVARAIETAGWSKK